MTKEHNNEIQKIKAEILKEAKGVLEANWIEIDKDHGFTRPARGLYPFQWNWDAGFIAFGYIHYKIEKAVKELRALFKGQWENGFLPHILFHTEDDSYFPNHDFWGSQEASKYASKEVKTSGITQPPVAALAVWHIYEVLKERDENKAIDILKEFYQKLLANHKYFHDKRDPEGWGLITIYHPWESGFDNSPRWDAAMGRLKPENLPAFERKDILLINPKYRPTNAEYDKYIHMVLELKARGYDDAKIYDDYPFKIKDKVISSILYMADQELLKMAEVLGEDKKEINEWLTICKHGFLNKLWDEQDKMFYDWDLITNEPIKVQTAAGVMPIITGVLTGEQLKGMEEHLDRSNFCGQKNCAISLVPSVGVEDKLFDPEKYWRGPVWVNVNWFLWKGLLRLGMKERAQHLSTHILKVVDRHGFWEYYSPLTGKGMGGKDFSWSAALAIDLLGGDVM